MQAVTTIGLDIAKSVFQVHGIVNGCATVGAKCLFALVSALAGLHVNLRFASQQPKTASSTPRGSLSPQFSREVKSNLASFHVRSSGAEYRFDPLG
jgi:hypothetical protein